MRLIQRFHCMKRIPFPFEVDQSQHMIGLGQPRVELDGMFQRMDRPVRITFPEQHDTLFIVLAGGIRREGFGVQKRWRAHRPQAQNDDDERLHATGSLLHENHWVKRDRIPTDAEGTV